VPEPEKPFEPEKFVDIKTSPEINNEISKVKIDNLAELYLTFLTAELNIPENGNYLRNQLSKVCESSRLDQVILKYSQAWR